MLWSQGSSEHFSCCSTGTCSIIAEGAHNQFCYHIITRKMWTSTAEEKFHYQELLACRHMQRCTFSSFEQFQTAGFAEVTFVEGDAPQSLFLSAEVESVLSQTVSICFQTFRGETLACCCDSEQTPNKNVQKASCLHVRTFSLMAQLTLK